MPKVPPDMWTLGNSTYISKHLIQGPKSCVSMSLCTVCYFRIAIRYPYSPLQRTRCVDQCHTSKMCAGAPQVYLHLLHYVA